MIYEYLLNIRVLNINIKQEWSYQPLWETKTRKESLRIRRDGTSKSNVKTSLRARPIRRASRARKVMSK